MSRTGRALVAAASVLAVGAVVVGGIFAWERVALRRAENSRTTAPGIPGKLTRRFEVPGLSRPPVVGGASSGLAEEEEVIGLVVAGRPRAYRLRALEYPPWHVVNDVVGGVPVTVAHCDLSGCTRAYSGAAGSGPLDVSQAGVIDGEMILRFGGTPVVHSTGRPLDPASDPGALPASDHEWTRTTWRDWKARHPTTDVFVGLPGRRPD
jgi:hypothetical protein